MNTKKLVLATLLTCLFVPAWADESPAAPNVPPAAARIKPVKNAPFSAEAIQETQHILADGNQITTKISTMLYRDSQGNTRDENRSPTGEVITVSLHTAADNASYTLFLLPRTGIKIDQDKLSAKASAYGSAAGTAIKERMDARRKAGKPLELDDKEMAEVHEILNKRAPVGDGAPPSLTPQAAAYANETKWAYASSVNKALGVKNIDGIRVEGNLRSYEIPAGAMGNLKPIVVSDETWSSPELHITVYSKHSDARSGDVTHRLTNVKRGEPAAGLFAVPSDYAINDLTDSMLKGW